MEKIPIKTTNGKIKGYVQIEDNGNKKALDPFGKILGYYNAFNNTTTDLYGKILARGDIVSSLIDV